MEYQITFPISIKAFEKYIVKHFSFLSVLKKSKRNDDEFYIIDTETEIPYFKLNYKDADVYYSSINVCDDNYRTFFHSKDFEALDKLCREGTKYYEEENEEEVNELQMYN